MRTCGSPVFAPYMWSAYAALIVSSGIPKRFSCWSNVFPFAVIQDRGVVMSEGQEGWGENPLYCTRDIQYCTPLTWQFFSYMEVLRLTPPYIPCLKPGADCKGDANNTDDDGMPQLKVSAGDRDWYVTMLWKRYSYRHRRCYMSVNTPQSPLLHPCVHLLCTPQKCQK